MQHIILSLSFLFILTFSALSQQDTITLYSSDESVQGGQNVCLPIYVDNFNRIEVLQFSVNWHPRKLYFTGIQNIHPGSGMKPEDIGLTNSDEGIAAVVFVDPFSGGNVLPDSSVLFEMCFNVIGEPNLIAPFNISDFPRTYEAYGNNRFLTVDGHNSRHKITAPNVGRIYARTCVDQSFTGGQGELRFTAYGTNPPLVFSVTKFGDPSFQESGQMNEGQVVVYSGLTPGEYRILVADIFGNEIVKIVQIESGKGWTVPLNVTLPTCPDSEDGEIEIDRIVGGIPPYVVSWSDGSVLKTEIKNLKEGRYSVTVEDKNRCRLIKSTILKNPELDYTVQATPPSCPNIPDGEIFIQVEGAPRFPDSTYLFGTDTSALVADTSFTLDQLVEGEYTIYIKDAIGCLHTFNYDLQSDNNYNIEITEQTKTKCLTSNDGSISFDTYLDGVLSDDIEISLFPDFGIIIDSTAHFTITDLPARTYELTLSSPDGMCDGDTTFTIEKADTLSFITLELGDETCSGDSTGYIYIEAEGGTGNNYTYDWSSGATGDSITNLSGGFHTVTVYDGNNCSVSGDFFISEGTEIFIEEATYITPTCHDDNNGAIEIIAGSREGVTSDTLIFDWEYDDVLIKGDTSYLDSLLGGVYSVTISDEKNCKKLFEIDLISPEPVHITTDSAQLEDCGNQNLGFISIIVDGGTAPYNYLWSNGDTTRTISQLSGDTYIVSITDANGCFSEATYIVKNIEDPDYEINSMDVTCGNGTNGQISISIENDSIVAQTYVIRNNDTIGISDGDIFLDTLTSGKYQISILTTLGCTFIDSVDIQSPDFSIEVNTKNSSCLAIQDGAAVITVSADKVIDSFRIIPQIGTVDTFGNEIFLSNLDTGRYRITLIDSAGCIIFGQFRIIASQPKTTLNLMDVLCHGDSSGIAQIDLDAHSGIDTFIMNPDSLISFSVEEYAINLNQLYPSTYNYYILTENGCEINDSFTITEPDPITAEIQVTHETSQNKGTASSEVSGGTPPYEYIWSVAGTGNVDSIGNLSANVYLLVVIDSNGCRMEFPFNIENRTSLIETHSSNSILYPNPASDYIIIELEEKQEFKMGIYDPLGRPIITTDLNDYSISENGGFSEVTSKFQIPISQLEDGIYFLRIYNQYYNAEFTFLKQR